MSVDDMAKAITVIKRRVDELQQFDPKAASIDQVAALERSIEETLDRLFTRGSNDYHRFADAGQLDSGPISLTPEFARAPRNTVQYLTEGKASALATLNLAIRTLQERIDDAEPASNAPASKQRQPADSESIFVVHGHDGEVKNAVARFITTLGLRPIILDEQANQGMTVIEKFEAHSNVGFAVVLLTPDDRGGLPTETPRPRARQNVVLELGFFVGALGRDRVCAIV